MILEVMGLGNHYQWLSKTLDGRLVRNCNQWSWLITLELTYQALITKRENH